MASLGHNELTSTRYTCTNLSVSQGNKKAMLITEHDKNLQGPLEFMVVTLNRQFSNTLIPGISVKFCQIALGRLSYGSQIQWVITRFNISWVLWTFLWHLGQWVNIKTLEQYNWHLPYKWHLKWLSIFLEIFSLGFHYSLFLLRIQYYWQ